MGYTPREVDDMSLWQFRAAAAGFARFHGGDTSPEAPGDAEFDAMVAATEGM